MSETITERRSPASASQAERRNVNPWIVLVVLTGGIFMLLLDTTIVNVAQQKIREGLDASLTQIQWVLDGYLFSFAVLLLTFGRLGDVFGRRLMFVLGMAIFTIASALCGASVEIGTLFGISASSALIGARVLQGVGGAMMMPQTLALITVVFPPDRRGAALGIWGGVTALGAVAGPIIGGLIATNYAWQWVFLINVPVGIAFIAAALYFVPESRDATASRRLDWGGIALSAGGIFGIVFALIEGSNYGWTSPLIIGMLAGGSVLLALFALWERRNDTPMVNLDLFRIRNFTLGTSISTIMTFGMFGIFFPLTIFLQGILGYTPIRAGLTMVPMALTIMIVAPITGRLSDRIGSRWLLVGGLFTAAMGVTFINVSLSLDTTWKSLLPALILTGTGMGLTFPPMTNAAMKEVPPRIAGSASGVLNASRNVGQILGIAILGSLLQTWSASAAKEELAGIPIDQSVRDRIVAVAGEGRLDLLREILPNIDSAQIGAVTRAIQDAFLTGLHSTYLVSTATLLIGATLALLVRDTLPEPAASPTQEEKAERTAVPVGD